MARVLTLDTDCSVKDFTKLIRTCDDPRVRQRLIGLRCVRMGKTASAAGELIGLSPAAMANWVHRYNSKGLEGLYDRPRSGRPAQLSDEQKQAFKRRIEAGPTEADGVVRFRWQEFQRILAEEYGAIYTSPYGVLKLVHSLENSWVTPRQIHPESSEEKKQEFKKNSNSLGQTHIGLASEQEIVALVSGRSPVRNARKHHPRLGKNGHPAAGDLPT